tara:strand:+ start:72 stop:365 length:294 start_codon:yes stop_codon:yes gene_type:complete
MFENLNNSKKAAIIGIITAAFAALFYFVGDINSSSVENESVEDSKLAVKIVEGTDFHEATEATAEKVISTNDDITEITVTAEKSETKPEKLETPALP